MSIVLQQVRKSFGEFVAVDDVSLSVRDGSLTALLGPSGSGKSTLLRIIAGLEEPDQGRVLIAGDDRTDSPPRSRDVGFVFQHYAAFKHMTVRNNVAFGLKIRKTEKERVRTRVDELLRLVHLEGYADRYPAQLSGGQRQRMALARALAVEPRVLLLDEPFGALDVQTKEDMQVFLRGVWRAEGTTVVMVTHDVEEAVFLAQRVLVLGSNPAGNADSTFGKTGAPASPNETTATRYLLPSRWNALDVARNGTRSK